MTSKFYSLLLIWTRWLSQQREIEFVFRLC